MQLKHIIENPIEHSVIKIIQLHHILTESNTSKLNL